MTVWSVYDSATGKFTGRTMHAPALKAEAFLAATLRDAQAVVEGVFDKITHCVIDGVVVDRPAKEIEADLAIEQAKAQAQALLNSMASIEQGQLRALRELALDPTDVEARTKLEQIDADIAALRASAVDVVQVDPLV